MLPVANMLPRQWQVLARFSVSALVASLPLLYVSLLRPPPAALAGDTAFWFLMSNCVITAIVAADDAGSLFFGSKVDPSCEDDGGVLSCVSGGQPAVAFEDSPDALAPLVASDDAPSTVHMKGQEDGVAVEPSTDKENTVMAEGQGGVKEEVACHSSATSDEVIPGADELAIIKNDRALAGPEPEPWPSPVTSVSIVEDVHEVDATEAWAIAQYSRTPDRWQGKSAVAGSEGKLQRSATEGSKPAAEESEYWELSDEELNRRVEEFIARFNREMRREIEQEAGV